MTIEQQMVVRGQLDYCSVTKQPNGGILVGSITVQTVNELREFGQALIKLASKFESPCGDSKQQNETK